MKGELQTIINFVKRKFIKETIWSFLTKGSTFVLFYAINIYLARALGVNKFGQWSFFFSTLTIFQIISHFGLNSSSRKFIAQYNQTKLISSVLLTSIQLRVITSLIFGAAILFFYNFTGSLMGENITRVLILVSVPYIVFAGLVEFLKQVFMGLHRIKFNFVVNLLEYGLKLGLLFGGYYLLQDLEMENILKFYSLALFLTAVIGMGILISKFIKTNQLQFINHQLMKRIFFYSLPLLVISVGFVITTELNTVMLGFYHSDTEVGVYSVASQITNKLPQIAFAISMGTMPVFAKLNKQNIDDLKDLFLRLLWINGIIFGLIVLVILFLSDYFVPLIFGEDFRSSIVPLKLLTPFIIVFAFNNFFTSFLDYQGLAAKRAVYLLLCSGINIVLNFIIIPTYGAVGAAISNSISYFPYLILNAVEVKRTFASVSDEY